MIAICVLISLCLIFSNNKKAINWRLVVIGTGIQFLFAALILKTGPGRWIFDQINASISGILGYSKQGVQFLFASFESGSVDPSLLSYALVVLPTIIFFSSLMALLYHIGMMGWVTRVISYILQRTLRTSTPETIAVSSNVFLAMTEAPLVIKPYIAHLTQSELLTVMTGGFATAAGAVLAGYVGMFGESMPDIAGHLVAASVMSAPAAIVMSKILIPETTAIKHDINQSVTEKIDANVIDAAARGARDGLAIVLNVGAMLIAFIGLIALINGILGGIGSYFGWGSELSLQKMLGQVFWPFAWMIGIPLDDCRNASGLLATKMTINEFVAFADLKKMVISDHAMSYRSTMIMTYALCGFSNFGSIAIQIGSLVSIAPERREDVAKLGIRAMLAGTAATLSTAAIASILL